VQAAREGTRVHPRGAYLWFLLARTLNEMRRFAAQGEVECCLRRSLALNQGLFVAADWLAMLLVEQRCYDEAEEVMVRIRDRLSDPSPAMGRLAWIHREKGDKPAARKEMASVLQAIPWYSWGWGALMEWLVEDTAWDEARNVLGSVPPELASKTQFRRQRLMVLEKAGLTAAELDAEWSSLLRDFPEDVTLHLYRYDTLRNGKRLPEAATVLEVIRPIDPESPFVLARYVEVLAGDGTKKDQAIELLLRIMFAETEESTWPADYAWKAVKTAGVEKLAYEKACGLLRQGSRPTLGALSILASYAAQQGGTEKRTLQPHWRTWFPDRGGRELLSLLKMLSNASWSTVGYRANLLKQLCDVGYARLVVKYWKKNQGVVEADVDSWAQTARALVALKRKSEARKLLAGWRTRTGVGMWVIANYVMCLSALRKNQLHETLLTCRDALAGLPHDHCAKYLVHRQAEACALLGDKTALSETWKEHRNYFNGKLEKAEWLETKRRHLLLDVPIMARALQENNLSLYKQMLRSLRWKRISWEFPVPKPSDKQVNVRWWWILWLLLWLAIQALRSF